MVKKMRMHYRSQVDPDFPDRHVDYSLENHECQCTVHNYYRKMIGNTLANYGNMQSVFEAGQLFNLKPQYQNKQN